ncbi:LacI family DNA-binding transcriptional regulator [Bacillus sp. 31A1R]|uniref:LacI family DNA-binding transcriptional regulator n=1 Tax=Robertmurraya mangrovi TaxID=3098077 RepID=A0ABU5IVP8_9BACI|nr:LacI family DNA-binding transcriptional regulator [Bacillus sp. 31A1R]MDZ5471215.1 LacI family DNA-binding transcriptional regulator [Bacillus sp. 31A1R]
MTTIKDIAKVAGVSVTTVSRALNGYSDVNEKTRQKIMAVAKELKYSPNTLARSLVMNKSNTIGLLVSGLTRSSAKDNFTFKILSGVNEYLSNSGYDLVLFSTTSTKQREKTYTELCRERRVDGVIMQGIKTDDPYLIEVVDSDIPCVLIDIPIESDTVGYVTTDNISGAKKAVQHLLELGHKKIAMVNGHEFAFVSKRRLEGFMEAHHEMNVPVNPSWIVSGAFDEDEAERQALKLLTDFPEITAVFCASDLMALGVIKAAKKLKIDIPTQLSIVGYDDILLASYVSPALTTVAQDIYQMGYKSAELLVQMLQGDAVSHIITLENELKMRESTAKNHDC